MSDFKTRLVEEQLQLEEKLDKLDSFILSDNFNKIDNVQKALLKVQATAMNTYNQCLKRKIREVIKKERGGRIIYFPFLFTP